MILCIPGNTTTIIAGNAAETGYVEGVGESARFSALTGFTQISPSEVIVADAVNHCLRLVDRRTGETQPFVGTCGQEGNADGAKAQFNMPWSIIKDNQVPDHLLVADRLNDAIRSVLINDKLVTTFANVMEKPKNLLQLDNGDVMITSDHEVTLLSYPLRQLLPVAGVNDTYGSADGEFSATRFFHPAEMLKLNKNKLMVADKANGKLRVLDLLTRQSSTFCTGLPKKCDFFNPRALLLVGDELYVGEEGKIIRIERECRKDWFQISFPNCQFSVQFLGDVLSQCAY